MANIFGQELANLIRDCAYSQGEIDRTMAQITRLRAEKNELEERLASVSKELAAAEEGLLETEEKVVVLRERIAEKAPRLPLDDIRSILSTPKTGDWEWGKFNREMIRVLKHANGKPISTSDLMEHCAKHFGIVDQRTASGSSKLRDAVGRRLREMAAKGAVERLPGPTASAPAYWVWVGLE